MLGEGYLVASRAVAASPKRLVVKFGGSSLGDGERIERAAKAIAGEVSKGAKIVAVVSAIGKTTDQLLGLLKNPGGSSLPKTDLDDILAMGERTSIRIFAAALRSQGLDVRYFDPSDEDWPILTDDNFSNANPLVDKCHARIEKHVVPVLEKGVVAVIAGFVGRTLDGRISTIGRGGSDTTAFILARGVAADEVILVTDADGIMTIDPKLIPEAKPLRKIDVRSLVGLADSGTKFIHRKALRYKTVDIPVRVINHAKGDLSAEGTVITGALSGELEVDLASQYPSMSITIAGKGMAENPELIHQIVEKVKGSSSLLGISGDSDSLILYVPDNMDGLIKSIHEIVASHGEAVAMAARRSLAYLRVKGVGLEETPGLIGGISETLRKNAINIFGILTIASSILLFVAWDDKEKAMQSIKESLR